MFANVPTQMDALGRAHARRCIPTDAAAARTRRRREVARVQRPRRLPGRSTVSDAVRPGVVATTKGRWPRTCRRRTVNATVDERDSDMGGGAVFHDNRVQVEPIGSAAAAPAEVSGVAVPT